jgi:surfeit locus 1 family protein
VLLPSAPGADFDFRRVRLEGRFAHDSELQLYGRSHQGVAGIHVLTPLIRPQGPAVLVDRGWVPLALRHAASRPEGQIPGSVSLSGIARVHFPRGPFTPDNDDAGNTWFVVDLAAMARQVGLELAPVLVEADAGPHPGGLPLGGLGRHQLVDNHQRYAFTWFALAAVLVVIFVLFRRRLGTLP